MSNKDKAKPEPSEEQIESIGHRLKRGRKERGLSLSDVVKQLNLASEIVEALESDNTKALPGAVFVQGYLRSYAKIIKIDAEPLIEMYQAGTPQAEASSLSPPSIKREIHSGHSIVRAISWTIGLGLVAIMVLWWVNQGEETLAIDTPVGDDPMVGSPSLVIPKITETEETIVETSEPEVTVVDIASQSEAMETSVAVVVEPPPESVEAVESITAESVALELAPMPEDAETAPLSHSEWEIVLTFSGPCWVNIKDADGKGRIVGNIEKGTVRTLEGPAPYSVVLGNAAAVELHIDGQRVDLARYSRGNVARFTLNPAELVSQ